MSRLQRSISIVVMALLLLTLAAAPALARESIIKRTTRLSDPGLIEVAVQAVSFDATSREIAVTSRVACATEPTTVVVVDVSAVQTQGGQTLQAASYDDQIGCGEEFTVAIPSPAEGSFKAGPVQIEVSAFACSLSCTSETVRLDVVLIPG
jgi:hypothetical protein